MERIDKLILRIGNKSYAVSLERGLVMEYELSKDDGFEGHTVTGYVLTPTPKQVKSINASLESLRLLSMDPRISRQAQLAKRTIALRNKLEQRLRGKR